MVSTPKDDGARRKLVLQLKHAKSRVALVAEAVGSIEKDDVWFVISQRREVAGAPIMVGECRRVDDQVEVSTRGLLRSLDETRDALDAALKLLGGKPTLGGAAPRKAKTASRSRKR